METSRFLSITASAVLLLAYLLYYKRASSGRAEPNATSWTLWVVLIILNAISYGVMTGDTVKAYLSASSSVATLFIFWNAVTHGSFKRLDVLDAVALLLGLIAGFVWWWFRSATYGGLVLQAAFFVSFFPTARSVTQNPRREPPLPWFLWGGAFLILLLVICLRWKNQPQDLVYPIQMFLWHTLIGALSLRRKDY